MTDAGTDQTPPPELEELVLRRIGGRGVRGLRVRADGEGGVTVDGWAPTFHAKQLVQHAVAELTRLQVRANRIEVGGGPS